MEPELEKAPLVGRRKWPRQARVPSASLSVPSIKRLDLEVGKREKKMFEFGYRKEDFTGLHSCQGTNVLKPLA